MAASSVSTRPESGAAPRSFPRGAITITSTINVWQSAGAGPRDDTATGLVWFSLEVAAEEILQAQTQAPAAGWRTGRGDRERHRDLRPWGTKLRLIRDVMPSAAVGQHWVQRARTGRARARREGK